MTKTDITAVKRTPAEQSLLAGALKDGWLGEMQADARGRLEAAGLPTRRNEAWKFTDLRAKLREALTPAAPSTGAIDVADIFEPIGGPALTVVNGFVRTDLSDLAALPSGVRVRSLSDVLEQDPELVRTRLSASSDRVVRDINAAFMTDGLVIEIEPGAKIETPLRIRYVATGADAGAAHHARTLIIVGEGASASVLESSAGPEGVSYLANVVTDVSLASGATLTHLRAQTEGAASTHLSSLDVHLSDGAAYGGFLLSAGAQLSRSEAAFTLAGEGASLGYDGVTVLDDDRHGDVTTFIDHAAPDCTSEETFRSAIADTARGVFQGKILVQRGAQHTDGQMGAHALLLSPKAEADAKPELEIYADDVKCAHGATCGDLDEEALFYMRSRGLDERTARSLLISAFLAEAMEALTDETARGLVSERVEAWLSQGTAA
ncbi:MAG: Fe-S cluster assembly protein SufD [Pseudomonadota bacterium]